MGRTKTFHAGDYNDRGGTNRGAAGGAQSHVVLGRVRTRRGDPLGEVLDEALALASETGELQRVGPVRAARAEAAWLAGNLERVREETRAAFDLAVGP